MKRIVLVLVAAVCVSISALTASAQAPAADQTLAVVNGEPIFVSEFNALVTPIIAQYRQSVPQSEQTPANLNEIATSVLNQRIEEILLKQEAKRQNIVASRQEIRDAIAQVKQRFATEADFNNELRRQGIVYAEFEKRLADSIAAANLIRQTVEKRVKAPTEAQVRDFYNKVGLKAMGESTGLSAEDDQLAANIAVYLRRLSSEQVRLRQIFINAPVNANADVLRVARDKVNTVRAELNKVGAEGFATVASRYSEDEVSRARGGDMGVVAKGDLQPAVDKTVFDLKVGQFTKDPIKTDNGYHFLKVDEKNAAKEITFDDVKNQIGEALYQNEARKAYVRWMGELRAKASIKVNQVK